MSIVSCLGQILQLITISVIPLRMYHVSHIIYEIYCRVCHINVFGAGEIAVGQVLALHTTHQSSTLVSFMVS